MFTDLKTESAQRITEVRESLTFIASALPKPPTTTPRYLNAAKGLIFVQLYGVIEFTIVGAVSKTIGIINGKNIKVDELKPILWSMVLDAELEALRSANRKKWDKRRLLFDKLATNGQAQIPGLMPTDGRNFDGSRFESVWSIFCIDDPVFDDPSFRWRLKDVITQRNEIAHGVKPASSIGAAFTPNDLTIRINEVSDFCSYIISVFEAYIINENYKK